MNKKRVLITGINGQDGSNLADLLVKKDYEVHGVLKRNSVAETQDLRIHHLEDKIQTYYGDLIDFSSIYNIVKKVKPDLIFNLAAQSQVRISSYMPIYTGQVNAIGVLIILEIIKDLVPKAHFYQASSSEMFGNSIDPDGYQRLTTPMKPVSPYGIAKLYAYNMVKHYRNGYKMFCSNGILFNHTCFDPQTPLLIKENNIIKIKMIKEIRKYRTKTSGELWNLDKENIKVFDGNKWTKIKTISVFKKKKNDDDLMNQLYNTRNGIINVTKNHNLFNNKNQKIKAKNIKIGDKLKHGNFPCIDSFSNIGKMTLEEAEFMGMMVADGWCDKNGKGSFSKNNKKIRSRVIELWKKISLGYEGKEYIKYHHNGKSISFSLCGNSNYLKYLHSQIYTKYDKFKKIPNIILNTSISNQDAFLRGYNNCDGLKKNLCTYEFKNFKTNSPVLALGLLYLIKQVTKQNYNITIEEKNNFYYYSINLLSPKNIKNHHLKKNSFELKKIISIKNQPDFIYNIETENGKLMAGIGTIVVSNSPRRGSNFVEMKITKEAVEIKKGLRKNIKLGNIKTKRDFGHSKDYVKAMLKILEYPSPDDWIIATGENHSIEEICKYIFNKLGMDYKDYIIEDPIYFRPQELHELKGDSSKSRLLLGWKPQYTFTQILDELLEHWKKYYEIS